VAALVVVDGALRPFGDAAMLEKFIAPLRGPGYEREMARSLDGMTQQIGDRSLAEKIKASMSRTPQHVTVSAMEATLDPALWKPDMIDVPVLMVMARNPRWNADYEQFVQSFIPTLDYQTWDEVSHFLMMEKPREFTDALVAFMRKHLLLPERS
jgi:pimeloyl-ACP methyl ester carboxylesterase